MKFSLIAAIFVAGASASLIPSKCDGPCPTVTLTRPTPGTACPMIECPAPEQRMCPQFVRYIEKACCCPTKTATVVSYTPCPTCTKVAPCSQRTTWGEPTDCPKPRGPKF